jgi:hypothetical protein
MSESEAEAIAEAIAEFSIIAFLMARRGDSPNKIVALWCESAPEEAKPILKAAISKAIELADAAQIICNDADAE